MNAWDYTSFGNSAIVVDILQGVKGIIGISEYSTLITIIALGVFFYTVVAKSLAGKPQEVVSYFFFLAAGMALIFGTKIDIRVEDKLPGMPTAVVQDVPIGIGVPLVFTNQVGWAITEWYENNMTGTMPAGLKMSQGAPFNATARVLKDMQSLKLTDPALKTYLSNYMKDCKLPELYSNPSLLRTWMNSTDVLAAIASTDELRTTRKSQTQIVTCKVAYDEIKTTMTGWNPGTWFDDAKAWVGLERDTNSIVQGSLGQLLSNNAVLDAMVQKLGGGSFTSSSFLMGNLMSKEISNSISGSAILTGSNSVISAINVEQAKRTQTTGWETAAILFQDMAGYFYSVMNLLVIGLSPVIILGIFIPKFGTKVVSGFIKVLVWLSLWWPALALVNHISTSYLFQGITASVIADFTTEVPWSINGATLLTDFGAKASVAAGFIATMVPMIMWGIISGSGQAFTAALQGASGKSEAMAAAKNIATDSASSGQLNYNSVSANKADTSHQGSYGDKGIQINSTDGVADLINHFGSAYALQAGKVASPTISASKGNSESQGAEVKEAATEQLSTATKRARSEVDGLITQVGDGVRIDKTNASSEQYQQHIKNAENIGFGLRTLDSANSAMGGTETIETGIGAKLGASIMGSFGKKSNKNLNQAFEDAARGKDGSADALEKELEKNGLDDSQRSKVADTLSAVRRGFSGVRVGGEINGNSSASQRDTKSNDTRFTAEDSLSTQATNTQEMGTTESNSRTNQYGLTQSGNIVRSSDDKYSFEELAQKANAYKVEFSNTDSANNSDKVSIDQSLLAPVSRYGSFDPNKDAQELFDRKNEMEKWLQVERGSNTDFFEVDRGDHARIDGNIQKGITAADGELSKDKSKLKGDFGEGSEASAVELKTNSDLVTNDVSGQSISIQDFHNDKLIATGSAADDRNNEDARNTKLKSIDMNELGELVPVGAVSVDGQISTVYQAKDGSLDEGKYYSFFGGEGENDIATLYEVRGSGFEEHMQKITEDRSATHGGLVITAREAGDAAYNFLDTDGDTFFRGPTIDSHGQTPNGPESSFVEIGSVTYDSNFEFSGQDQSYNLSSITPNIGGLESPNGLGKGGQDSEWLNKREDGSNRPI